MAQPKQYIFDYKELAEIMVKHQGIHKGHWGIYAEFSLKGTNVNVDSKLLPSAILMISAVGLQRFEEENPLTVDAAKVNPADDKCDVSN